MNYIKLSNCSADSFIFSDYRYSKAFIGGRNIKEGMYLSRAFRKYFSRLIFYINSEIF